MLNRVSAQVGHSFSTYAQSRTQAQKSFSIKQVNGIKMYICTVFIAMSSAFALIQHVKNHKYQCISIYFLNSHLLYFSQDHDYHEKLKILET